MEPLKAAGDDGGVGSGFRVGVGLGAGGTSDGVAVAPVDDDAGSADIKLYDLVGGMGGPGGDEGVVWHAEE